ncbi:hypothetical protein [Streptomyces shaanxiensis]
MVTPSLVSKVCRPGCTTRNSTNTTAQNPSSQRRDRGPSGGPDMIAVLGAAAGGGAWTVDVVMVDTAGG